MRKALIAIAAVAIVAAALMIYDLSTRVEYTMEVSFALGFASIYVEADLDEGMEVSLRYDGEELVGTDAQAGGWMDFFVVRLPDVVSGEDFEDGLEVYFDGRAGRRA